MAALAGPIDVRTTKIDQDGHDRHGPVIALERGPQRPGDPQGGVTR
jgi:hypothetical protein